MSNQQITITPHRYPTTVIQIEEPGPAGPPGTSGSSGASYHQTFTQSDLSIAGILVVTHSLSTFPSGVTVWDGVGSEIGADDFTVLSPAIVAINLTSFVPLQGQYTVSITT